MTGTTDGNSTTDETDRAQDRMLGFSDTDWNFTSDGLIVSEDGSTTTTYYYYPTLKSNTQEPAPSVSVEVPVIDTDLSSEPVLYIYGKTADELSISASISIEGELSYQWYSSTDKDEWMEIEDAVSYDYTPSTTTVGTTYYKVVVTNTIINFTEIAESKYAEITVITTDLADAISALEKMKINDVSQGIDYDTEAELEAYIKGIVDAVVNNPNITVSVTGTYTPAIAGTSADEDGTDGTYSYTITLTDKEGCTSTYSGSISIIANKYELNEVSYEVSGTANATIADTTFEQLKKELFSEEELASDEEKKVIVKVDVVAVEDMDEETQAKFDAYLEEYNEGLVDSTESEQAMIFDISVIKSLAGVEETITELDTPITITIDIPEEYQADGREFFILRSHDGEITVLIDLDDDPTTITFTTDCFSNYTLNYIDVEEDTDTVVPDTVVPDTGDTSNASLLWVIMGISFIGMVIIWKKKLVK